MEAPCAVYASHLAYESAGECHGGVDPNAIAEPNDGPELVPHGQLGVPRSEAGATGHGGGGDLDDPGTIGGEALSSVAAAALSRRTNPAAAGGEADGTVGVDGGISAAPVVVGPHHQLHESISLCLSAAALSSRQRRNKRWWKWQTQRRYFI
uniref:Uncharacterized protein n=1 Tax=Arundo donax TaxID=35708 RepID=A0A0A8XZS2_ARUDO